MESWRERGFVPDSDEEDEFDSQDAKKVTLDAQEVEQDGEKGVKDAGPVLEPEDNDGESARLPPSEKEADTETEDEDDSGQDDTTPKRRVNAQLSPTLSTAPDPSSPSTPRQKPIKDIWDVPTSSPDELQLLTQPSRGRTNLPPRTQGQSQSQLENDSNEFSPLSSPPSSLHSIQFDENEQNNNEQQEEISEEQVEDRQQLQDSLLEDLVPASEIPEELLRELTQQGGRRSLRQRNPIQLHPYLLEDAKYRNLMMQRGVKPVRIAQYQQALREAAKESQGQDFNPNDEVPSSSPPRDFLFPPSSPPEPVNGRPKRPHGISPERPTAREPTLPEDTVHRGRGRPPKRRRKSISHGNSRSGTHSLGKPAVVINNSSSPRGTTNVPPSPPQSGSASTPTATRRFKEFIVPRGLSSSPVRRLDTASRTEKTPGVVDDTELPGPTVDNDNTEARSVGSNSQPHSDIEEEEQEEQEDRETEAVKRLQKRIKGVLPASWLRLDQEKQRDENPSSTQRAQDRSRPENSKGVAKKVTKKSNFSDSRGRLSALQQQFAEDDSDQSGEDDNNVRNNQVDTRQILAQFVGSEDPFFDQNDDEDIPEDNRIDYMFEPATRGAPTSGSQKKSKKRSLAEGRPSRSDGLAKRPRLQRQTRLTDDSYGAPKARRSTRPSHARLGILDAPDVTSRPRTEQPQFLRVAARNARSRQDKGRRSPSRKVLKLSSRRDTDDINSSLREWRSGGLRQTKLPRIQAKPRVPRRPLADLSPNKKTVSGVQRPRKIGQTRMTDYRPTQPRANSSVPEHEPNPNASEPVSATATGDNSTARPQPQSSRQGNNLGNKWIIHRNLAVSSFKRSAPRPAGLESTDMHIGSAARFHQSLAHLNQEPAHRFLQSNSRPRNILMDRFLSNDTPAADSSIEQPAAPRQQERAIENTNLELHDQTKRHRLKKRPPTRLDLGVADNDQASPLISPNSEHPAIIDDGNAAVQPFNRPVDGLVGLQRTYSVDFNVTPLHSGTYFHETTFIGSGEFYRSLEVSKRDLDKETGTLHVRIGDQSHRWGPWNDAVSSEIGVSFDKMMEQVELDNTSETNSTDEGTADQGCATYRSLIRYVTENLTFIDPVDRKGFVQRVYSLVSKFNESLANMTSTSARKTQHLARSASYNVVLANQAVQVACHGLVGENAINEGIDLVKSASRQALTFILSTSAGETGLFSFLEKIRSREWRHSGVRDDQAVVEAYVAIYHILKGSEKYKGCFGNFVDESLSIAGAGESSNPKDVKYLEDMWHKLFAVQPLNEFDVFGISHVGSRFKQTPDNWAVVKRLLSPVLDGYDVQCESQPISSINYCRVLFHRCFHLINGWGWRDCKLILDTLYDFFARRTLYNLKHEESYKSPAFLDELDRRPSLEVYPSDPCFHILLKIIASGLLFLSKIYDKKKIRNFAWRLLPNHGRVYPKEKPIHQTDLDALRNHHDLLCTLYFAVPNGYRPRLETIKNLVHPANSHREACIISLRAWTRLARFKLSTDEGASELEPFADWHCYFVTELLKQHSLARKEIESQNNAESHFSHQLIERTIAQNQRQIESLLKIALNGLENAVKSAPTLEHAQRLVSKTPLKAVLGLFNPKVDRVNTTVSDALQVIVAYIGKCNSVTAPRPEQPRTTNAPITTDDDSQEYGDWSDIEAVYGDDVPPARPEGIEYVEDVFHPAVSRLVSNCFGEDHYPEDAFLLKVVDCWSSIAQTLVKYGLRHWDSYLSPYEGDSWVALRGTEQTRKFTPKFLASCIEKDAHLLSECRVQILGLWMTSLVERVSMLKFQHHLTEALVNRDGQNPVLQNLPFSRNTSDMRYSIALEDLIHRRLSLISSLLSNMRTHIQYLEDGNSRELSSTKHEYRELIQKMMSSMKENYKELGDGGTSAQGAYVDFVHRIVGFLQQHTRDICPINPFFTDPTTFPLPSTDPTYIVARLKSYEPKLSSEKVAKTLIVFVQGVSERAAIDGQQGYLVEQLHASMAETYEAGNPDNPTLRAILLQSVFPAYLQTAFDKPAAWILARPIIHTISLTFQELFFNIDTTDPNCVASVINILHLVFQSSYQALQQSLANSTALLREPSFLLTAASFVNMITSSLRVISYITRATNEGESLLSHLHTFENLILFLSCRLHNQEPPDTPPADTSLDHHHNSSLITDPASAPKFFHEIHHSATRELKSYISESWSRHQGRYYFTRRGGLQPQELELDLGVRAQLDSLDMARGEFDDAAMGFVDLLGGLGMAYIAR